MVGEKNIAETLLGKNNPGGKLPVTFPKSTGQLPLNFPYKPGSHGGQNKTGSNGHDLTCVTSVLYPFG